MRRRRGGSPGLDQLMISNRRVRNIFHLGRSLSSSSSVHDKPRSRSPIPTR